MGEWTPEPWAMYVGQPPWVRSSDGSLIAAAHDGDCEANARRIVACVNALAGWTTEALEQLAAPLADQLRKRDERIRKLEEAARAAYAHVIELQDAWIRGALSEHDGLGGTRSNRNDDVLHLITHALGEGWMDYEQIAAVRARLRATLNKALMKCNPSPLGDEGCDADIALDALVAFERAEAALIGYGWCQIHDRRRGAEAELEKLVKATEA